MLAHLALSGKGSPGMQSQKQAPGPRAEVEAYGPTNLAPLEGIYRRKSVAV